MTPADRFRLSPTPPKLDADLAQRYGFTPTPEHMLLPWSYIKVIRALLGYTSSKADRRELQDVLMEIHEDVTYFVASDGKALLIIETPRTKDSLVSNRHDFYPWPFYKITTASVVLAGHSLREWRKSYDGAKDWKDCEISLSKSKREYPDVRAVLPDAPRSAASSILLGSRMLRRLGTTFHTLSLTTGNRAGGGGFPVAIQAGGELEPVVASCDLSEHNKEEVRGLAVVMMPMRLS